MAAAENGVAEEKAVQKPMFRDLNADDPDPEITEIESLCLHCEKNGITKLLLTKIPFYKEVVIMSFNCDHCGWENNELQPAAIIQEKGVRYNLRVTSSKDLSRQVVKTEWASVSIPELEFEIPTKTQEGTVTTIEGVLQRVYDGLEFRQRLVQVEDPEVSAQLGEFLKKFVEVKEAKVPFHFILSDCSGNSFLENLHAPHKDPEMEVSYFERSRDENLLMGIVPPEWEENSSVTEQNEVENVKHEVLEFPTNCPNCNVPCVTKMKVTNIPHFKDVVIMATSCDACGHNTNEVKSSGGIEPRGVKISLSINSHEDLTRDLLKSDTCRVLIPELELEVGPAAISGRYTTVEGLISCIKAQLAENNPMITGDAANPEVKERMASFLHKLDEVLELKKQCTLILDDPCGNSYLQSIHHPGPDSSLVVENYERTFEQNDELGLNDMKVENYEKS